MKSEELTDETLMTIIISKTGMQRNSAFACLFDRYSGNMKDFFSYRLNGNDEKAKDLTHDLFHKIIENPEKFDTDRSFKTWIFRVASNMCKNEYRRTDIEMRFKQSLTIETYVDNEASLEKDELWRALRSLKTPQVELLLFRYKYRMQVNEIAKILDLPEGTVKSRLFHAIKALSKQVKR